MDQPTTAYLSPEEIASSLQDAGYKAKLVRLDTGRKVILSAAAGFSYTIYLIGPDDNLNAIKNIQFSAVFSNKPELESVNKWNMEGGFGKAYLDEDNALHLEWDCVVEHATSEIIKNCAEWWAACLANIGDIG